MCEKILAQVELEGTNRYSTIFTKKTDDNWPKIVDILIATKLAPGSSLIAGLYGKEALSREY